MTDKDNMTHKEFMGEVFGLSPGEHMATRKTLSERTPPTYISKDNDELLAAMATKEDESERATTDGPAISDTARHAEQLDKDLKYLMEERDVDRMLAMWLLILAFNQEASMNGYHHIIPLPTIARFRCPNCGFEAAE